MKKVSSRNLIIGFFIMILLHNVFLQIRLEEVIKSSSNAEYEATRARSSADDAASYASDASDYASEAAENAENAANKAFGNECWSCPQMKKR